MSTPIIATKLYIPTPRPKTVFRSRLIERLNDGLHRKLTLISAPAGFGKTTLVSEWVVSCQRPTAWLSLDEGDNDPSRFLAYCVAALQTIAPQIGEGVLGVLQSPQPPPIEAILTALLNQMTTVTDHFILVLDDYHSIEAKPIHQALAFLLDHLPPQMHLVIATREDPSLPLARLRVRDQLTELRITDLRFTLAEAADFLNPIMGLNLSEDNIAALETRTEGWIAGLQLAAISMQEHQDTTRFIKNFTGSHYFVMDYLVEEVLHQQSKEVQTFLLQTSILNRLCGSLCDAVLGNFAGQETLEYLQHRNLFIVPLDNERRWYRYHHLFAELLRQRFQHSMIEVSKVNELHLRASLWYEENGWELEAFHHAAAAHDIERAEYLIEGKGMPLHFRGAVIPVLNWLKSLPTEALNTHPSLWTVYASTLLASGQASAVEATLQSAETALHGREQSETNLDLIGRIAAIRATLAASQMQIPTIIAQSVRALEYLHPHNLAFRTSTAWKLGFAYQLQGDRAAATQAYTEVITIGEASGNFMFTVVATIGLGNLQESENLFYRAAETYQGVLKLMGDHPIPIGYEAYLGLVRIHYEWNELETAEGYWKKGFQLLQLIENNPRLITYKIFLARLKLAQNDVAGASVILAEASQLARQYNFVNQLPDIAAAQILVALQQDHVTVAAQLAQGHDLPMSQARVYLAQDAAAAALTALEPVRQQAEKKGWEDEQLKVIVLLALAHYAHGEKKKALQLLSEALRLAEVGGFIRSFLDEGRLMAQLLSEAATRGIMPAYVEKLLTAFEAQSSPSALPLTQSLIEPLSERELEVLQLIAQGLSNSEISERLFLALSTVKGHNQQIFGKLQVQRRTEAVARARELGLL